MQTQPPFSSVGGLFAFSIFAMIESKILALKQSILVSIETTLYAIIYFTNILIMFS